MNMYLLYFFKEHYIPSGTFISVTYTRMLVIRNKCNLRAHTTCEDTTTDVPTYIVHNQTKNFTTYLKVGFHGRFPSTKSVPCF